ncbi:MAG: carbohydrate ABC transporter permease [Candidatus Enteromonas sp.]|nr:carbohydrate ABC transporter permease [Candidatus Enteromonas sp.]
MLFSYWRKRHLSISERVVRTIVWIIFALVAFSYIYLVFWCFYSGLRTNDDIALNTFGFSSIHPEHYIEVFSKFEFNGSNFFAMIWHSVYFSFFGPLISIFVTSLLAYCCAKYKFVGSALIPAIILIMMTLPIYGNGTAMYRLLYNLNWLNSYAMIFTSFNGFTGYFLYFFAFYKTVSSTYAEAASLDGANPWQIFFRIIFPQSLPMFGALFLMAWIGEWNAFGSPLIYMPNLPTLSVGIYQFQEVAKYSNRLDLLFAGCALSMLPPLVLFAFCNKTMMENVSIGGIKE